MRWSSEHTLAAAVITVCCCDPGAWTVSDLTAQEDKPGQWMLSGGRWNGGSPAVITHFRLPLRVFNSGCCLPQCRRSPLNNNSDAVHNRRRRSPIVISSGGKEETHRVGWCACFFCGGVASATGMLPPRGASVEQTCMCSAVPRTRIRWTLNIAQPEGSLFCLFFFF